MKKLLTTLCICALALACFFALPTRAEAATAAGDFRYTFYYEEDGYESDYVAITGYAGTGGEITIPDTIYGYPVTEIADRAFYDDCAITCVNIPSGVTKIGTYAFRGCLRLEQVNLPDTLKIIGQDAFSGCESLKSINLPDGLTTISGWAFDGCSNLQSITIPDSVTAVEMFAFRYCASLETVILPAGITEITKCLFFGCDSLQYVTIPESVTSIGEYAFYSCDLLQTISIPDGVSKIEKYTFGLCYDLINITLPESIDVIKDNAFFHCFALNKVYYGGTESQWEQIYIAKDNETLTSARRVYLAITGQPKNTDVAVGKTVKVTVKASGDGLTYQWYYKDEDASEFVPAKGYTTNTYSTKMTAAESGRQLYCLVSNKHGDAVTSDAVTIRTKAAITKQPVSVAVAKGATAKITVKATGEGLTYQWYYKNKSTSKFTLTKSFTGNTYSAKMGSAQNGRQVYCVVTDQYGNSVESKTVTLSIKQPAKITKQPKSVTVASGKTATVTVKATGDGLTYKWYYKNKGASKFKLTTSFTGASYKLKMDASRSGRQVYCVITDKYGNKVTTKTVTLSMKATITTQPKNVTVANGKTAKVTVKAAGEGLSYKWYYKNKGASKFSLSSVKSSTYSTKMSSKVNGRKVYCVVKDKFGNTVKTSTVTLKRK